MPKSFRRKAVIIIVVAIVVRFAFILAVDHRKIPFEHNPDAEDYLSFAHNLATGVGFAHALNEAKPYSQPVEFSAWRTPLYPMFLAVAFQISRNTLFLQSLQVVLSAFSLYFFLRLGYMLFGELPALIAGLVFALYVPLIRYEADLCTESLFLFLMMTVLFLYYRVGTAHSVAYIFGLGLLTGLSALCRPNGLMLLPALAVALWFSTRDWKRTAVLVLVLGLGFAVTVLPWTYRNYRLFHRFVLISSNGGANLWFGAHFRLDPNATMDEIGYSQHGELREVPEPDREQYFYRKAMAILDHSPRLWGKMFWENFKGMYPLMPSAKLHSFTNRMVYSVFFVPVLFTGVIGWAMLWRRWRELSLLWAWVAATTFLCCISISSIRYRVPTVDPVLMMGTGVCLAALVGRKRGNPQVWR